MNGPILWNFSKALSILLVTVRSQSSKRGFLRPVGDRLKVTIIGPPSFYYGGHKARTQSRKADALLAFLALSETGQLSRESAAGLLWSESSEARARMSLRQAIKSIRRALDEICFDGFRAEKDILSVDLRRIDIDMRSLVSSLRGGLPQKAAVLHQLRYAERILHGCDDLDENYHAWVRVQRQVWSDLIMETIEHRFHATRHSRAQGEPWAKALIAFDPSHEPATRYVMETRALNGDQSGALATYRTLSDTLLDEFDTEPNQETQRLNADIKLGNIGEPPKMPSVPAETPISATEHRPVLIVHTVSDSQHDPRSAELLAVLRQELISLLVRFREWSVVDWNGVNITGHRPAYTVLLSARFEGEKFTYNLNLRDDRAGCYVWGQTIRRDVETIYEEQETFVRRMASALNIHLSADRLRRLPSQPHLPADHFETWAHAQKLMYRWRDADDKTAENLLLSIIKDVPGFGPAHSALAQHANGRHIVCPGVFRENHATEMALESAQTARLLDPLDSKAHLSLAWSEALLGRFPEAENSYRDALQLNDNDPWVLTSATHGLAFCQTGAETGELVKRVLDLGFTLAPEHWSYLAGIYYLNGDYEACISASRRVLQGYYGMKTWTIAAQSALGDKSGARDEANGLYATLVNDWRSTEPANPVTAGDWLADMFPIRDRQIRVDIREALAEAGFR